MASSTKADERPRTPRRRNLSQNAQEIIAGDGKPKGVRLPVIACKINDKEYKALVNTGSQHSTIHRRILDANKSGSSTTITIGNNSFKANFLTEEMSIHDVVLGMDFITSNNCILNFSSNNFTVNSDTAVSFVQEEELPMKYRTTGRTNLTASM